MKKVLTIILLSLITMTQAKNRLLEPFNTPFNTAPFTQIDISDYKPAVEECIKLHQTEIDAIVNNTEQPTFKNTIEALDAGGRALDQVTNIFYNISHAESNDEIMALQQEISPLLSEHSNNITLNEKLFEKIKYVYENCDRTTLQPHQIKLLDDTYKSIARQGANLEGEDREKYRELTKKLSALTIAFGQNVLKSTNSFEMLLTDTAELAGLPESTITMAKELAESKGKEGYMFNLSFPSYLPFLKYSTCRDLREKIYRAYSSKALSGEFSNIENVKEIVSTRKELANLLGYNDWAAYVLERRMAQNSESVYFLLDNLLQSYKPYAEKEVQRVYEYAKSLDGDTITLKPWDWTFYSDKLKDSSYDLNDEMLKPYFELSRVKEGVFGLATTLYGLKFEKRNDIEVYHPEVEVFEVTDADNRYVGILYTDFHPRDGKQGGAWMTEYHSQWIEEDGTEVRPHVSIVMNFSRPTEDTPALLTFDEVETLLHEFGHALHSLLSRCQYASQAGTSVYRDFVELPSQVMENWLSEKEFLDTFAVHYQTGEKMPNELIDKIIAASQYNAAYSCLRQLSFGFLDMAWHTLDGEMPTDVIAFEREAMNPTQLLPLVDNTAMSTQFSHIFSGGYAAGYYGYKWAEVLDADAFAVFKANGIFDKATAEAFRTNILERGGSDNPATLYRNFKGSDATIDALIKRDGVDK